MKWYQAPSDRDKVIKFQFIYLFIFVWKLTFYYCQQILFAVFLEVKSNCQIPSQINHNFSDFQMKTEWYSRKTVSSSIHNSSNHTTALSQDKCNSSLEVLPIWSHRILKRYLLTGQDLTKIVFMTSTFFNYKCIVVKTTMTIGTTQCYWHDSAVWLIITLVPSEQMTQ